MLHFLIGYFVAISGFVLSFTMMGASWKLFVHVAEIIGILIISIALVFSTFGAKRFFQTLKCVCGLKVASETDRAVLKRWISATYAAGILVFLSGLVVTLSVIDQGPMVIGAKTAASLSGLIVSVVISEFLLRTALSRGA